MTTFDSITNEICGGKENEVDTEADFKDAGAFSVAFFPRIRLLAPFVEIGHCLEELRETPLLSFQLRWYW